MDVSFSDCGFACDEKEGCTAFNFHENPPNCYLRECPIPAPTPIWSFASEDGFLPNFDRYYWTKSDDKFFEDSQCPNIDSRSELSLDECIDECNKEEGCTAVNFAERQPNCVLRQCQLPVQAPTCKDDPHWSGYHLVDQGRGPRLPLIRMK